ncbi:hypothetical protein [Nocardia sp. XZ_19_369]|uniref:hypothetical protein n=1 Tax=Nocardia sp. XZ_19_369 TaxID=2769487 RepID=UPI00188F8367|nr:hypothetical protein [Nocardia sp. XZ_19_369]
MAQKLRAELRIELNAEFRLLRVAQDALDDVVNAYARLVTEFELPRLNWNYHYRHVGDADHPEFSGFTSNQANEIDAWVSALRLTRAPNMHQTCYVGKLGRSWIEVKTLSDDDGVFDAQTHHLTQPRS